MSLTMEKEFSTPMMKQYMQIKKEYKDCLLFFRLGDFYELFLDDAKLGANLLGITLTKRPRGKDGSIPMAGVPYHAADAYIAKLVKAGHKVAICEQVSEPDNKGIVEREVVRIVTPGTVLDEKSLEGKRHNYTMSISFDDKSLGTSIADVSTGDFHVTEYSLNDDFEPQLAREIARIRPSECILEEESYHNHKILKVFAKYDVSVFPFSEWEEFANRGERELKEHFEVGSLAGFGIANKKHATISAATLLGYLRDTQKGQIGHIKKIRSFKPNDYMVLDHATMTNLELFSTIREGEEHGSLIQVMDHTKTAMGGRLIREWITHPLIHKNKINARLDAVEEIYENPLLRDKLRSQLTDLYDIERILSRLSVGIGVAADIINLKESLKVALEIKKTVSDFTSKKMKKLESMVPEEIQRLIDFIEKHIEEDGSDKESGGLIKKGVSKELDKLRDEVSGGREWMAGMEKKVKEETGISTLKIGYNKVFGYYIEVSKAQQKQVPNNFIRKQTLVNAERYITPELKDREEAILYAKEKIEILEQEIFEKVIEKILEKTSQIQKSAEALAQVDCLASLASLASEQNYVKPEITLNSDIEIKDGRHPVVEKMLETEDRQFIPNDVSLNTKDNQLVILTGPNMAGKSVFIRQIALITLLAHIGSFVPAKEAKVSLVDRIFVRSGASDVISSGLSTFMVEMVETAHILHNASSKSLIIIDEIGRGTSTYDGISIAWAVAEYLVNNAEIKAKTLFATHYHELQRLEEEYPDSIKNYQMAVEDENEKPVFLHKVISGGTSHSYAVAVARLAGIPDQVTNRALEILDELEKKRT